MKLSKDLPARVPSSFPQARAEVSSENLSDADLLGKVPRIISIIPLIPSISTEKFFIQLLHSLDLSSEEIETLSARYQPHCSVFVPAPRFKSNLVVNIVPSLDLYAGLDVALVSDAVLLLMSSTDEVQLEGEAILRSLQGQAGNVTVLPCVQVCYWGIVTMLISVF